MPSFGPTATLTGQSTALDPNSPVAGEDIMNHHAPQDTYLEGAVLADLQMSLYTPDRYANGIEV
jgi:hypothetical protein